jgi:hypothetical protein
MSGHDEGSVRERLARMEAKQDGLIESFHEFKVALESDRDNHKAWTKSISTKVDDLEHLRWYFRGIAALGCASFIYFKEEIKKKLRGMP